MAVSSNAAWLIIVFSVCFAEALPSINVAYSLADPLEVYMDRYLELQVNFTCSSCGDDEVITMNPIIGRRNIAIVHNALLASLSKDNHWTISGNITIFGIFLGKTNLTWKVFDRTGYIGDLQATYNVNCLRKMGALDYAFSIVVSVLVAFNTIAYACTLDLDIVKEHLKKPIGVGVGFFCQYGCMPLVSNASLPHELTYSFFVFNCRRHLRYQEFLSCQTALHSD
jgi:hypothetical protein